MQFAAPVSTQSPVLAVAIDDKSLRDYGQWPWPRQLLASLVDRLAEGGAKAVVFDILFAEDDRLSPDLLARQLPGLSDELRSHLSEIGDSNAWLAQAMGRTATVTGSALSDRPVETAALTPPARIAG